MIQYINLEKENLKARDWFPFRNKNLIGDISKIEKTGFKNKYSLEEGLREIYLHLKKNNKLGMPILNNLSLIHILENLFIMEKIKDFY